MIKARIRWCTCRVENILTLGKLLSLWFCFLLHSILFLISQTSYRTYKIISSNELARPVMGTIFLVNNLLHLVIVKYGDISLVLCISTRLRLVTILSLLVKYLVIYTLTRVIGRAKRAPHWGVQSRFRVIYICCRYVVCRM